MKGSLSYAILIVLYCYIPFQENASNIKKNKRIFILYEDYYLPGQLIDYFFSENVKKQDGPYVYALFIQTICFYLITAQVFSYASLPFILYCFANSRGNKCPILGSW